MCHTTLLDSKFVEFLVRTDEKMAEEMRAAGCVRCGSALHLNSFPRKPRGMPPAWTEHFTYRLSFDCSVCSKRHTPPSVRFLEHRVYLAFAVVLSCAVRTGSGQPVRFGLSTLQRWFHAARAAGDDPVTVLRTRIRVDAGRSRRLSPAVMAAIEAQYKQHPSWSVQLHYENLSVALGDAEKLPSYATVCRHFEARGLRKLRRGVEVNKHFAAREVRSFEVEHTNGLWHLDFHEGSRNVLTAQGQWAKPYCLCVIDDRSRLACHIQWYLDQTTERLVHGFSQALMRRALPRAVMTDNGSAMMAEEFTNGLHALGILHQPTLPYTPWAKGKLERLWVRWKR